MEGQVKLSHILPFSLQFWSRRFLKDLPGAVGSGLIEMQLSQKRRISREEAQLEPEREGDGADVESC